MVTIYTRPGLQGLELWRGMAGGTPLFRLQERRSGFLQGLREFLVCLHHGNATADDARETEALQQAAGFHRLVLCGGGALDPALRTLLHAEALPFTVEIDTAGPFAARRGSLHLFQSNGWQRGLALDLGQVQLKVITASGHAMLPRDTALLPFGATAIESSLGRARLRDLLREALSRAVGPHGLLDAPPDGVVLALPVALSADGTAEPATYPGLFGPVQPLVSGLFDCPCLVLNDAVLAAVGFPPAPGEKTLVVTLGFGVGGALWAS